MLKAITRCPTPDIARCELQFRAREPIDYEKAAAQHSNYTRLLAELGADVISLPPEEGLPDAVFVEDPAVILDEIAVLTRPGAPSRRPETESIARALTPYRPLRTIEEPATLEGGDVLRIGRSIFVGLSTRTNREGIEQLTRQAAPFGYTVEAAPVRGCLHLKSACCHLGDGVLLGNPEWFDARATSRFQMIAVAPGEPGAANVLAIGGTVLMPECFPRTAEIVERAGYRVRTVDISELQKAEAGLTCSCLLVEEQGMGSGGGN